MDMQPTQFGASMEDGKHFSGIEPPLGVKRTFDPLLMFQIIVTEHDSHKVALFNTNAMLSR